MEHSQRSFCSLISKELCASVEAFIPGLLLNFHITTVTDKPVHCRNMEQEKIFNLQLTVQRLEEELALYRNGTTMEQMFDLIKEKEVEINDYKSKLSDKDARLRKIAKSSSDVLTKCEEMTTTNRQLTFQLEDTSKDLATHKEKLAIQTTQIEELTKHNESMKNLLTKEQDSCTRLRDIVKDNEEHINDLECELRLKSEESEENLAELSKITLENDANVELVATREDEIVRLKEQIENTDKVVEKLHRRCAELVADKAIKLRILDQERQEMITHVQEFRVSFVLYYE
jgi:chromosome segregation ATPase